MRRLAVSDLHGEADRLLQVLRAADFRPGLDRLFLLGDYIDRGPDSAGVVRIVRELVECGAVALKGNHDHTCVMVHRGPVNNPHWQGDRAHWISQGGDATLRSFGGPPSADVLAWLDGLPLYHEEPDCILVHAGLRPDIPLEQQDPNDLMWIRREFHQCYRGRLVVFGHTPTRLLHGEWTPWFGEDKVGIDTGAVWGGVLTLFDMDTHETWTA